MTTQLKDETVTVSIADALKFPEGTPIQRMVGKLTHIFDRKSGEGKFGEYTSQSGVIEQDGSKILFTVWNMPTIPEDYKGRLLVFRHGGGKKPTMTLKSDFKDASKRTLNVTKSCHVLTEEEDSDDIPMSFPPENKPENRQATEAPRVPTQNAPKAISEPKKAIVDGLDQVRHRIMQYVNLRKITDNAVESIYGDNQTVSADNRKDISTCFFIQALREGLADKLPNSKPIDSKAKKADLEEEDNLNIPEEPF